MKKLLALSLVTAACLSAPPAYAHGPDGGATITPTFNGVIPNVPGKSLKTVTVTYASGGSSPGHHHAASAFIYAYVLEGAILSQVEGKPARVYKQGEFFTENPGDHHVRSANASKTKRAKLLAVFVVDTDDANLTTPDK